jgi:hypothetical protein
VVLGVELRRSDATNIAVMQSCTQAALENAALDKANFSVSAGMFGCLQQHFKHAAHCLTIVRSMPLLHAFVGALTYLLTVHGMK